MRTNSLKILVNARVAFALVAMCATVGRASAGAKVSVDWNESVGAVKPVHGVGQPPMIGAPSSYRMMHHLKRAGIPYSRLHDVGGGRGAEGYHWYTTWPEHHWFKAWRRVGRDDLARQALDACLKYALTDEYQVGERYQAADPWFYPWSPNASGSGRIVQMILDLGEQQH